MVKQITVLGATGSIGQMPFWSANFLISSMVLCRGLTRRRWRLWRSPHCWHDDPSKFADLRDLLANTDVEVVAGVNACAQIAAITVDLVIAGVSGLAGLRRGSGCWQRMTANKESWYQLELVMRHVAQSGTYLAVG